MLEDHLTSLGLSPSEIKTYLHLLRTGRSYVNKLSSELKINRSNIYEALERLIAKGLVSFIVRNNVKWFEARAKCIAAHAKWFEARRKWARADVKLTKDSAKCCEKAQ